MSTPLALLIAAVLVFAVFLLSHLVLLKAVFESNIARNWKLLSLIPFVTPVAAWKVARRKSVVIWGVLLAVYFIIRLSGG